MTLRRARAERFGAILDLSEPPALVSVDRVLARKIGIDGGSMWDADDVGLDVDVLSGPTEAHVAATDRCPVGCSGCYADAKRDGHEPSFSELCERLERLRALGVFRIAFGGGEATLRDDLGALAAFATELGMVPTLTTSGLGVREARIDALRAFAQINVSLDGLGDDYVAVRGVDASEIALRAIAMLVEAGIAVGINTVLTRATFDRVEALAEHVATLGAREMQLLRFKPSGRGGLDYLAKRLSSAQTSTFVDVLRRMVKHLTVRIDCSLVPFLAGIAPSELRRFGVAGCEAGRSLLAVRANGAIAGCSFLREGDALDEGSWRDDRALGALRDYARAPAEPCASCEHRTICRGGCRVVAAAIAGNPHAPDPECPRVIAHRRSA